jgi:hypothetical protein
LDSNMSQTVREQIIEQVDRLDDAQQRQVLEFARRVAAPSAAASPDLLRFAGSIDRSDLDKMSKAIEDGCERVDQSGW